MTEYGSGGETKDKKIMFISLGVLCVIFLVVTAFVWSSVNRRNQTLANSVAALESQIKTMKGTEPGAASPSDGASAKEVASLREEIRLLSSRIDAVQQNAQKVAALAESGLSDARAEMAEALRKEGETLRNEMERVRQGFEEKLQKISAEGKDARAKLLEGARKSLAFQKEFLQRLELLLNSQEKLMPSSQ